MFVLVDAYECRPCDPIGSFSGGVLTVESALNGLDGLKEFKVDFKDIRESVPLDIFPTESWAILGGQMGQLEVEWSTLTVHPYDTDKVKSKLGDVCDVFLFKLGITEGCVNMSESTEATTSTLSTDVGKVNSGCIANNNVYNPAAAIEQNTYLSPDLGGDDSEVLGKFWAESNVWGDLTVVEAVQRSKVTGLKAGSLAMDFTNFGPPNVRFVVYFLTLHVIADPLDQQCDEINAC